MNIAEAHKNSIRIISQPESINIVEKLIDDLRATYNICEDSYGNMLVAITEAVNNAIFHGNKNDPSKMVNIVYEVGADKILFTVQDEGLGFDFYDLPDPTSPENLEKPNGRGIFLMKALADQIIFAENGRIVELYFKNETVN